MELIAGGGGRRFKDRKRTIREHKKTSISPNRTNWLLPLVGLIRDRAQVFVWIQTEVWVQAFQLIRYLRSVKDGRVVMSSVMCPTILTIFVLAC